MNATTTKPPLTPFGIILTVIGAALLLFPGGCSLYVLITALPEISRGQNNDFLVYLYIVIGIGFALALTGFFLLRAGLRRRRAPGG